MKRLWPRENTDIPSEMDLVRSLVLLRGALENRLDGEESSSFPLQQDRIGAEVKHISCARHVRGRSLLFKA
jgi:hypothetical protein